MLKLKIDFNAYGVIKAYFKDTFVSLKLRHHEKLNHKSFQAGFSF